MGSTVDLILGIVAIIGLFVLIEEIKSIINKGNIAEKDAEVIDLTKKIQDQKIVIDGKEKTADELLAEYRKQAEDYHKFDSDDQSNKPPN